MVYSSMSLLKLSHSNYVWEILGHLKSKFFLNFKERKSQIKQLIKPQKMPKKLRQPKNESNELFN
jgi:hypothetical protein